jgi:hypothetical protein
MIAVAVVIYDCKNIDVFIDDYFESLKNQSNNNFIYLLFLDGVEQSKIITFVRRHKICDSRVFFFHNTNSLSPTDIRKEIITAAYNLNVETLIFSDIDDVYSVNRVENVCENIENNSFVFNNFFIVDSNLNKLYKQSYYELVNCDLNLQTNLPILHKNYIGLGSTALNLSVFPYNKIDFPSYIQAFDWYLATYVLLSGGSCYFLENTYAFYRQHNNSFIGSFNELNMQRLNLGIQVKLNHYNALKEFNKDYSFLYDQFIKLKSYISLNGGKDYIKIVNKRFEGKFLCWWQNILTLDEIS